MLGGGALAREITRRLRADGHTAVVVREGHDPSTVPGVDGRPTDADALAAAGESSVWRPDGSVDTDGDASVFPGGESISGETEPSAWPHRADGGLPAGTVAVRRGTDSRLRTALSDDGGAAALGCTTITVYPRADRQPGTADRLLAWFVR